MGAEGWWTSTAMWFSSQNMACGMRGDTKGSFAVVVKDNQETQAFFWAG
jgi:hypothetical protein